MNKVRPTILPALILDDNDKVVVVEHKWDGKNDHFIMQAKGHATGAMVHMRQYQYHLDESKKRKAVVYMLADDRLSDDQLATLVSSMGPWFYTYGYRID